MTDDRDLARLLSGRREPSVLEKEEVLERVLHEVAPRPASRRVVWGFTAAAFAAAALALLALLPWSGGGDEFAARGGDGRRPSLRAICVETGQLGSCPARGTLAFELDAQPYAYAALFARGAAGAITWYFPPADGRNLAVKGAHGEPLRQGIRLGESQPPGRYELVLVLSHTPLDRAEVRARLTDERDVAVVRQTLVVQAAP
jgi:hypothetical protein